MNQLTPELERRLQVEELWARRNVLADYMNAERRERFHAQRTLLSHFGSDAFTLSEDAELEDPNPEHQSAPPVVPAVLQQAMGVEPAEKGTRRRWWMIASLLAGAMAVALSAPLPSLASYASTQFGRILPHISDAPSPSPITPAAAAPAPQPPVENRQAALPDSHVEVSDEPAAMVAPVPRPEKHHASVPDLKAEVSAEIAASMGRHSHSQRALRALRSR